MNDIQIIAVSGYVSPAESDAELLKLIGIMTIRFNVLENCLATLICLKKGILMIGKPYDDIQEMSFVKKIIDSVDYVPKEIKIRLFELNINRNKIIHGLYKMNGGTKKITMIHKGKIISDVNDFLLNMNQEISDLSTEIHNIIIYPNKLDEIK